VKVAGLDASSGLEYVGIVIGESSALRAAYRRLKARYWRIHCKRLPSSLNRRLVEGLLREGVVCVCLFTRINRVVKEASEKLLRRGVRTPRRAIKLRVERALGRYIAGLLLERSVERVYADIELVPVLEQAGIVAAPGYASELADPVAWANYRRLGVGGIEDRDIGEHLLRAVLRRL